MVDMPPRVKTFLPPNEPFVHGDIWIVDVSVRPSNPIFRAIYHVGFIDDRVDPTNMFHFGGYNMVWSNVSDAYSVTRLHYFKPIRKLASLGRPEQDATDLLRTKALSDDDAKTLATIDGDFLRADKVRRQWVEHKLKEYS